MAEERLIDDDKDRKYRIRINEDGEEELVLGEGAEEPEEESVEELSFEVPEQQEDDEEAAVMTPEQLEEKRRQEELKRQETEKKVAAIIEDTLADMSENKYSTALEKIVEAEELLPENGKVHELKLRIYTRNFTDYEAIEKAAECADDVKEYVSAEDKAQMFKEAEKSLKHEIGELSNSVNRLDKENEEKKAQRAVRFNADKKKALVAFLCGAIPLAICIALAIYFSTVMFSSESGVFLILAIVFAGLSFVGIIVVAFLGRALNITARRVRLNKKNTSTKIGRQLIAEEKRLEAFNAVYAVLQDK